MAAKDLIHNAVKQALIKDGWTITHDPYTIEFMGEFAAAGIPKAAIVLGFRHPDMRPLTEFAVA